VSRREHGRPLRDSLLGLLDVPREHPFACDMCGSVGMSVPVPLAGSGNLVIGLDPECEGCQTLAQDAGIVFPPRFGDVPIDDE
jgi:hypothetical protein